MKLLEKNIGKYLLDINMSDFFMNISPQASKMNKWDYMKPKSFCTAKDTIKRTKRYPIVWENETGPLSNPIYKGKLKMDQRPECKS